MFFIYSKKSKNKSTDSNVQKQSAKDDSSSNNKKSQKSGNKHNNKDTTAQQHTSGHSPVHNNAPEDSCTTTLEDELNAQTPTTYVHIEEQKPQQSASIQIARSDSPTLPPSPISSSTSSLFTPFGSLSSNFMSSSSPSPPPSNGNLPLSFSGLGGSSQEDVSPIGAFVAPPVVAEHKRPQSPLPVFGSSVENGGDSLFSHMGYLPVNTDCGSYNGLLNSEG